MNRRILLIGGGGHCHSVLDSVLSSGQYDQIGIVAKDRDNYEELMNDELIREYLIGTDSDLPRLYSQGWEAAFISLGSIGSPLGRIRINEDLIRIGFSIPVITDKTAAFSQLSEVSQGCFIGKTAVVNAGTRIGQCSIINTGAIIEHDCNIGAFCHVSPGAVVCGKVTIGDNSHIGAGAVVRQGIEIGKNAMIGAGSVVVKDILDGAKAFGNPCRMVK